MRNTDYTRSSKTANKQPKNYQLKTVKNITEDQKTVLGWEANPIADKKQTPLNKARMSFKTSRE